MESREELDRALLRAVEHTEEKQRELAEEPPGSPRAPSLATDLVHRAEDVDALATDARAATEEDVDPRVGERRQERSAGPADGEAKAG